LILDIKDEGAVHQILMHALSDDVSGDVEVVSVGGFGLSDGHVWAGVRQERKDDATDCRKANHRSQHRTRREPTLSAQLKHVFLL
jgi:hypothetical protein